MAKTIYSAGNDALIASVTTQDDGDEIRFVDIDFKISEAVLQDDKSLLIEVSNELLGELVGFSILLNMEWEAEQVDGEENVLFYRGAAVFLAHEDGTKRFIDKLAKLYGLEVKDLGAEEQVSAEVIGLSANPANYQFQDVRMKFCFNTGEGADEELYSEVYINLKLNSGILEWHEKDPAYRMPLIRSLAW